MSAERYDRYVSVSGNNPAIVKTLICAWHVDIVWQYVRSRSEYRGKHGRSGSRSGKQLHRLRSVQRACPEEAIKFRSEIDMVKAAVNDPSKTVIFSTSPSVRVGIGDAFYRCGRNLFGRKDGFGNKRSGSGLRA